MKTIFAAITAFTLFHMVTINPTQATSLKDSKTTPPKLVVFISIDQWRYDLLEKYQPLYKGGFKTIWQESQLYQNAYHDHAATETGPGHSVLLTGRYPSSTGIVRNHFFDRIQQKEMYCVEDPLHFTIRTDTQKMNSRPSQNNKSNNGVSPKNLLVPTLGDYLKSASPLSKVYSVSGKDRAAILMGGKKADGVFWFDKKNGELVSSSYYMETLPQTVVDFNKRHYLDQYFNQSWDRFDSKLDYKSYTRKDKFKGEPKKNRKFPYHFTSKSGKPNKKFYSEMRFSPYFDEYLLEASLNITANEQLGKDNITDLMIVGLSGTDYIGHRWGPHSQEMLDHLLRLDMKLDDFFKSIYKTVGKENVVIAMSADHGVLPLPEYLKKQNIDAHRISEKQAETDFLDVVAKAQVTFKMNQAPVEFKGYYPFFAPNLTKEQKGYLVSQFKTIPYVAEVILYDELNNNTNPNEKPFFKEYRRAFHKDRNSDFEVIFKPNTIISQPSGTTHGSVYDYDQHVPVLFLGAPFKSVKINKPISTVDIAPTLLQLLNQKNMSLDGTNLLE